MNLSFPISRPLLCLALHQHEWGSFTGIFSDGLTEQIINGLCKVPNLFVIARNSSFAYKGKP
jgi:TolB-like protein